MKQLEKTKRFLEEYELALPIIMAPMAGASPPALAAAVSNAGGMGACGVLMLNSRQIRDWTKEFKSRTNGSLLLNTWIPDPEPTRDPHHEKQLIEFYHVLYLTCRTVLPTYLMYVLKSSVRRCWTLIQMSFRPLWACLNHHLFANLKSEG